MSMRPAPDYANTAPLVRMRGIEKAFGFVTTEAMARFGLEDHVTVYLPFSYTFTTCRGEVCHSGSGMRYPSLVNSSYQGPRRTE